ncbi:amidohydrolase family protein [uncultured Cocleimonas sp.]|uniref:amidohydrolase family protein n=1 Tax=uncultured Cocleimonas sp. TaxID=1051587 RepID=UPI0026022CDB|nr:amidohydrolase family protein [uncultured Cocleimonas sp.]
MMNHLKLALIFSFSITLIASKVVADDSHIGEGAQSLPIFDAHIHYKEPAWGPYPPKTIIEMMDKSGVAMGLVSSTPDEGTIMLWKYAPDRIVPELRPYHGNAGSSNWTKAPGMEAYLEKRLDEYPHEGIGEFHLHNADPADRPLLEKVAAMAIKRDLYIHVHSDAKPVAFLFSIEPKLKIIWAHAGMNEPADLVAKMMSKYKNLWADTSFRESDILADDNSIDPEWRKVLETFPDRFMVGSDTWINDQWADYDGIMIQNRRWLAQFSREHAEMFAYKNAERLFKRKVKK